MKREELKQLLKSMTIEEKIGQLVQLSGNFFDEDESIATGPISQIGLSEEVVHNTGSILNTFGAKKLKDIQKRYLDKSNKKIPMIFMADVINGYKTGFPIPLALGCSFDPEMVKKTAQISAHEASVSGLHVTFSPMVDLVRDARWGRVMESYGEDTYLNCEFSKAMVQGYQDNEKYNLSACVKHFAGYGAPIGGREYNTVELGERTLREYYLPAYKAAIDAGSHMVMTSFNTLDGIPATSNEWLLRELLREEWGFEGIVISDHSAVKELIAHGVAEDEKDAAKLALSAGCDIDMMTSIYSNNLKSLVEESRLDESYIDEACMRVLELKNKLGLFENPYGVANEEEEQKVHLCKKYRDFACDVVTKTCVLLQNKNKALPLSKDTKVALIGPFAQNKSISGMWSFTTDPEKVVTVENGFENLVGLKNIQCTKGSALLDDTDEIEGFGLPMAKEEKINAKEELEKAISIASNSDVIVLALGEHPLQSGEGGARGSLLLPKVQMNLLKEMRKLNKKIVVLLFSGRPLEVKEIQDNCDALLQCWFPGLEGGNGIAKLVYGDVNPSGRLSMSLPYSVGQCPVFYNSLNTGRPLSETSHMKRFSSRYVDMPNDPLYCFGYGLSYSEFKYDNLKLSSHELTNDGVINVSIDITNTSDVDGCEVVQLYIRDVVASIARPVKELKGVKRVDIKGNETKTVTFEINEEMLRFVGKDMKFISEDGKFEVFVGKNSEETIKDCFVLNK